MADESAEVLMIPFKGSVDSDIFKGSVDSDIFKGIVEPCGVDTQVVGYNAFFTLFSG